MSLAKLIGKFQNADKNNGSTNFISLLINDNCTIKNQGIQKTSGTLITSATQKYISSHIALQSCIYCLNKIIIQRFGVVFPVVRLGPRVITSVLPQVLYIV